MSQSIVAVALALALGVLPVLHDVCGPDCEMGEAPVLVAVGAPVDGVAPQDVDAGCPLHPAEEQAPARESDGCTHDHGTVREAPESPMALAPSDPQSLELPVATFTWTLPHIVAARRGHAIVSFPVDRVPRLLALRV